MTQPGIIAHGECDDCHEPADCQFTGARWLCDTCWARMLVAIMTRRNEAA